MRHAAMNKFYRIVWNAASQCWQAVCETARGKSKSSRSKSAGKNSNNTAAILISTLLLIPTANAEPTGGNVTAGQGNIQQSGTNTTITQQSPKLAIDWNTFSINAQDSVNFIQPNSSSIALNRVTGAESSSILGSLTANGQVWILNPNGVLFGNSAQINVGGLVASTLKLSNQDFLAGNYCFTGNGTGTVENRGTITVPVGGTVALMAPVVRNNGSIIATQGNVLLAAAEAVTIKPVDSSLAYTIDRGTVDALVENGGLIQADGGRVVLTAAARDSLAKSVTNNTGIIEANTVQNHNGTILLLGDMQNGTVNVAGTLSTAAPKGGDGGFIETSAAKVKVADGAIINTTASQGKNGQWLIDPTDFTIAATGGDITGTQLGSNLGTNNVTIQSSSGSAGSNGDVNVNDSVSWSANKLTLNAQNNININSSLNGSGTAQLALEYGQGAVAAGNTSDYYVNAPVNLPAGNSFSTKLGSDGTVVNYTVITDLGAPGSTTTTDLQGMQGNVAGRYALGANIDASATSNGGFWGTAGFSPVGSFSGAFSGSFAGLGHTINSLTITRPSQNGVGLFGFSTGQVRNLGLVGGSVSGSYYTGGLMGDNAGTLSNAYATGSVSGTYFTGGLVGYNSGTFSNAYATGSVSGTSYTGGLVGYHSGTLRNAYATGSVSGINYTGGLVGENAGTLSNAFYDVDQVSINGAQLLTQGGLFHNQYQDWVTHDKTLNLANYFSLSSGGGGYYNVSNVQGLKDMLGFTLDANAKFRLGSNLNLSSTPGFYFPAFAGTFDGDHHVISNLYVHQPSSSFIGLFGRLTGTVINLGAENVDVSGSSYTGGLVGYNFRGTLSNAYATGSVSGSTSTGGLVGLNLGELSNAYATSSVSGIDFTGGLVGFNAGTLRNGYATGSVSGGSSYTGGLVGYNNGSINASFWDTQTTGQATSAGGIGLTTAQMQQQSNFTGFDFANTWIIYNDHTNPLLRSFMTPLTVIANSASKTYDGLAYSGTNGVSYSSTPNSNLLGTITYSGPPSGVTNAGSYTITPGGLYSNQQGYSISYVDGALTIDPRSVNLTGSRIYDGTTSVASTIFSLGNLVSGETLNLSGAGTLGSKNVAAGTQSVSLGTLGLGDGNGLASNYTLTGGTQTATLTPKALTLASVTADNKDYDGNTTANISAKNITGIITNDAVGATVVSANFDTKNVGTGKTVTVNGIALTGADAGNYSLNTTTATTLANITPKALSITGFASANKVYDRTTRAIITNGGALTGVVTGDAVSFTNNSATFSDRNAGINKTVTLNGVVLGGLDAANYTYSGITTDLSDITPKPVSINGFSVYDKKYDGTTLARIKNVGNLSGIITGDFLGFIYTNATFANPLIGRNKTVTLNGVGLNGADALNYIYRGPTTTKANIFK